METAETINGVRSRVGREDYGDPANNVRGSVAATVEPYPVAVVIEKESDNLVCVKDSVMSSLDDEDLLEPVDPGFTPVGEFDEVPTS